jgi:riboflavin synthase
MFTGLVETTGEVIALDARSGGARLQLKVGQMAAELAQGDSVAVNGCCLTATDIQPALGTVGFDLLEQTLRVTSLGDLQTGEPVNLERALAVGARLGGHFVQGHVDDTLRVLTWRAEGADYRLEVELPAHAQGLVIPKGSICLDGISLTAAEVMRDRVVCWIIPHTLAMTNLRARREGGRINVEWDMLGKYVRALMKPEVMG